MDDFCFLWREVDRWTELKLPLFLWPKLREVLRLEAGDLLFFSFLDVDRLTRVSLERPTLCGDVWRWKETWRPAEVRWKSELSWRS